ncbi:MAG: hypothetical protein CSA21_06810 [Deltaproteobacteria bacterium]|nr:MAG: hypothetical protein CSA21_06810 [Deltaproteobacteria bacterium]
MVADTCNVLLAGGKERFVSFAKGLDKENGVEFSYQSSGAAVLEALAQGGWQLVAIDEKLEDMTGLALLNRIAEQHPFVNTALVSTLGKKDFHEETEGLGVLLKLPSPPDAEAAARLLAHYRSIWGK